MNLLSRIIGYVRRSTAQTAVGLSVLAILALGGAGVTYAATSYDVHNVPDMKLDTVINTTQTDDITINWPKRNSVDVAMPTTSGGVLEFKQGNRVEHIYYSRAVNDADNETFTLTGTVIRNLDWNNCAAYVSDGNGQRFTPGADVRLVNDCRLYNLASHLDRASVTSGSGSYQCGSSTQPCIYPGSFTTAQRDAFTYGNDKFSIIFNTTAGVPQYRSPGSAWVNIFGSGVTLNATTTTKGSIELATQADILAGTVSGDSSATLVAGLDLVMRASSGATNNRNKILASDNRGFASGAILASNLTTYFSSGAVALNTKTVSGSYALAPNQLYVPLSPVGAMMMWTTDTAPAGWLLADGKCHTRTGTGAKLFAVIGTTFQGSCPSNTFGVPDMRGRFALGQDDMGGTSANRVTDTRADTIGSGSGSNTHTQSKAELAAHSHVMTGLRFQSTSNGAGGQILETGGTGVATSSTGSSLPMDIMNPYLTLNYIIRAQ